MATCIKRNVFDFLARNYTTPSREVEILTGKLDPETIKAQPHDKTSFVERWYLSLQGEDTPVFSETTVSQDVAAEQYVYRYDWAFGVAGVEGFWWNWRDALCAEENAVAVHIVLQSIKNGPQPIPIGATLRALQPSKNTKGFWEVAWPKLLKGATSMAQTAAQARSSFNYLATGLMLTSDILESHTANQKNWFLYQFLDEKLKSPAVEWQINKQVLVEYGPLLRGTLFLAFHGSAESTPGHIRLLLRPQLRYCPGNNLDFIIPTDKLPEQDQVYIDVRPKDAHEPSPRQTRRKT